MGGFIFFGVFFSFGNYVVNFFLGKVVFVVGDGDGFGFVSVFVVGGNFENFVGVEFERDFDLGNVMGSGGDVSKFEFVEEVVVFGYGMFIFVNLD